MFCLFSLLIHLCQRRPITASCVMQKSSQMHLTSQMLCQRLPFNSLTNNLHEITQVQNNFTHAQIEKKNMRSLPFNDSILKMSMPISFVDLFPFSQKCQNILEYFFQSICTHDQFFFLQIVSKVNPPSKYKHLHSEAMASAHTVQFD